MTIPEGAVRLQVPLFLGQSVLLLPQNDLLFPELLFYFPEVIVSIGISTPLKNTPSLLPSPPLGYLPYILFFFFKPLSPLKIGFFREHP